ncbi:6-hydroxymethylpterin diphosphokinase MptE-like protein [Methanomassiliicoccus luminyensis]|uniref:6-hydroxymethylpterin diphosphokinase MptE-like protein n=1 Tax=Methanomassiliicoccus luminyensis TaxID=1080712 RepID=UPI0003680986|nr:6-hydroxymethylpterin diphosphokinase MptE-like protein [Methanomassiliicoccus luminyensis]
MDFSEWEPYYREIVSQLHYSVAEDERAARVLAQAAVGKTLCSPACLAQKIGPEVTVCGCGLDLEDALRSSEPRGTLIAADGATSVLLHQAGRVPDIIVTDLDGAVEDQISANAQGAIVIVHAHGDNVPAIERFMPWFTGRVVLTTQARPLPTVRNFGGLTDGDRAVMLARHFGAKRIHLLGFDMSEPREKKGRDPAVKKEKLKWARKLIWDLNPPGVELSSP